MRRPSRAAVLVPGLLLAMAIGNIGATRICAGETVDYVTSIKPLLAEKCYSCHGRLRQEADLRLETRSLMVDRGVIVPGDVSDSELIRRVTADGDERMPPPHEGAALRTGEIELLRKWVQQGAVAPDEEIPADPADHWAFRPIVRPPIPGDATSSAANPIDAFLSAKRTARQLKPQPQAERKTLLRRLYLDLIGLPPTLDQLRDDRPWDQIVDELLVSPHHGERWGRHWMDVWRYCDWYGLGQQLRYSQKHIWHWRDWIVESLNEDKGYDEMIREMLAADELMPNDTQALRATGYLARNYYLFNRTTWLDSTIEHTGKAFFGLTLSCAKCHDHKYDPITQTDYYRMRAIFEPHQVRLDPVPGEFNFEVAGLPRVFDDHVDAKTFLHVRGNPKDRDEETPITPAVPAFFGSFQPAIEPIPLPYQAYAPGARDYVQRDRLQAAHAAIESARRELKGESEKKEPNLKIAQARVEMAEAKLAALSATIAADNATYRDKQPPETSQLLAKTAAILQAKEKKAIAQLKACEAGGHQQKQRAAQRELEQADARFEAIANGDTTYASVRGSLKALETPEHQEADYPATYSPTSTGRRRALAHWITSSKNPLTARVAVNHVWMRHFGEPIVESVFDFGLRTPQPANVELLDFLAYEFMQSGWSFRHLHRLMVTSETYKLSSSTRHADSETNSRDPNNHCYWRANSRRMESQVVRDSLLHHAGELDTTLGGPSVAVDSKSKRRSLYFKHSRDDRNKFLKMFDDADLFQCYRRSQSIAPQQALALSNSKLSLDLAAKIARRLQQEIPADEPLSTKRLILIEAAFETLLARQPTSAETDECVQFFDELGALPDQDEQKLSARFVHAIVNHNDFISIR